MNLGFIEPTPLLQLILQLKTQGPGGQLSRLSRNVLVDLGQGTRDMLLLKSTRENELKGLGLCVT